MHLLLNFLLSFFNDTAPTEIYPLSLHDALPISRHRRPRHRGCRRSSARSVCFPPEPAERSEEHTSELQSRPRLVCRLLLEKKRMSLQERAPRRWSPLSGGAWSRPSPSLLRSKKEVRLCLSICFAYKHFFF